MLERQERTLDTLRTQAVALLSAASIVAGLFGGRLLSQNVGTRGDVAVTLALVLFGVTSVLAIIVLLPWKWKFTHDLGPALKQVRLRRSIDPIQPMFVWAQGFESMRADNEPKLNCLMKCFWAAVILVGAQVVCWSVAVF